MYHESKGDIEGIKGTNRKRTSDKKGVWGRRSTRGKNI